MFNKTAALVLALALSVACLASSCIASHVKPVALFPPAALTWPAVAQDYQRGIDDGVGDGDLLEDLAAELRSEGEHLGHAIEARDVVDLRTVPWASMKPWAARGIADELEDGEIGPGVAQSLTEQLENFSATITRLQETF